MLQTSTTSTTYYPNKFYSLTSTKAGSNTYATSTNYIWNGDTLLATIDQPLYNGAATGTAIYRYIHPDHLGSTNVVTDGSGTVAQLLDYYPYGATRISSNTYPTNEKRQYIGQYSDTGTGLSYLQARYYDSVRGQFISQDPVFLGNPGDQDIRNPQSLNAYSYANDNPIVNKDTTGKTSAALFAAIIALAYVVVAYAALFITNPAFHNAVSGAAYNAPSAIVQPLQPTQKPSQQTPTPYGTFGIPQSGSSNFPNMPITNPSQQSNIPYSLSSEGIAPEGVYPPAADPDSLKVGPASRPSQAAALRYPRQPKSPACRIRTA